MKLSEEKIKQIKDDIQKPLCVITNHYVMREGFVFMKGPRDRIFDEIIVRSPSDANCYTPIVPIADKTINDYIDLINGAELDLATIFAKDISFLIKCPSLKHISIHPSDDIDGELDFTPLYNMENIKSLYVKMTYGEYPNEKDLKNEIDYSKIKGLECLSINFESNRHKNFDKVDTLKTLFVSHYPQKDLQNLFSSKILDSLFIITSKISTLCGISQSKRMQCVYLLYNRSLKDITELYNVRSSLKVLMIENCPKISDFSILKDLDNLEVLILRGKNKLPDLNFLTKLKKLKIFFFSMEIENGDLTPCLSIPFVDSEKHHKNYNLKNNQLPSNKVDFKNTGLENIEYWRRIPILI